MILISSIDNIWIRGPAHFQIIARLLIALIQFEDENPHILIRFLII